MAEVGWSENALADIQAISDHLSADNPRAAGELVDRLFKATDLLQQFPFSGRRLRGGLRELTTVHPYLIRFEPGSDLVRVVEVRHGARRPNRRRT